MNSSSDYSRLNQRHAPPEECKSAWARLRMSPAAAAFVVGLMAIFSTQFAARPLWHADLWDHVNYGTYILAHQQLPSTEPLLPLSDDARMSHTEWGSQILFSWLVNSQWLSTPGLQLFNAAMICLSIAVVGIAVWSLTGSAAFGITGYLVMLWINWQQFLIIRPQSLGVVFFSMLWAVLITRSDRHPMIRWALPPMFIVWANVHGSFAIGLFLLSVMAFSRYVDVFHRTQSFYSAFRFSPFFRLMVALLACVLAALLNPDGWEIYPEVLRVGRHPNVAYMYEWAPLSLQMKQGRAFAIVSAGIVFCLLLTKRRRRAVDWIPLVATGVLTIWSSRMINWFAPIAATTLCVHAAGILRRHVTASLPQLSWLASKRDLRFAVVTIAISVLAVFTTPLVRQQIGGGSPNLRDSVSAETPVELAALLKTAFRATVDNELVFYPAEWAGFLMWQGNSKLRPMVNLHVHVIPEAIWLDYVELHNGSDKARALLKKYNFGVIVIDRRRQQRLEEKVRKLGNYRPIFEDSISICFVRVGIR